MTPYQPGTVLAVEWEDSATETNSLDWQAAKALRDALAEGVGILTCHSVGFFVYQSPRVLTLAQNTSDGGYLSHVIHIPNSAIRGIEILQTP